MTTHNASSFLPLPPPSTALQDYWNWLDFFIVIVGIIPLVLPDAANFTMFRTFRGKRCLNDTI